MSTDPGTANSGNSVPCSGKCQERKHKIISVPVMGLSSSTEFQRQHLWSPSPSRGCVQQEPLGCSSHSQVPFSCLSQHFPKGNFSGFCGSVPHRNQLHLELALPPCIARGEEPDGSAAATAPKFSLGKLRESLWALLLEHDTNKNPQKGEMQPEPPGSAGSSPKASSSTP